MNQKKAKVSLAVITDTAERLDLLAGVIDDVVATGNVTELRTQVGAGFTVEATVVPPPAT